MTAITLASTSPYRRALLARIGIAVQAVAPNYDEVPIAGLSPDELILAHARHKAADVASRYPNHIVIGCDQGVVFDDRLLGKPGTHEAACRQLKAMRAKTACLTTCLVVEHRATKQVLEHSNRTWLRFRELSDAAIDAYVRVDNPLDCAGSFKIESRGPLLFTRVDSHDPTAIEGLPVMALLDMLEKLGLTIEDIQNAFNDPLLP